MKKTYFFDMDGTLVVYERHIYIREDNEPWYTNIRDIDYFATAKPYDNSLALVKHLINTGENVYLLTSIDMRPEHMADYYKHVTGKIKWITKWLPELDASHLLLCSSRRPIQGKHTKSIVAEDALGRPLTKQDVLIDDYNPNLNEWMTAGGTAIKIKNDVNSFRDDLPHISIYNSIQENMRQL